MHSRMGLRGRDDFCGRVRRRCAISADKGGPL